MTSPFPFFHPPVGWQADLIGAPWQLDACGPDAFDCWGLDQFVWAQQAGLDLSPFRTSDTIAAVSRDSRTRHAQVAGLADTAIRTQRFIQLDKPRPLAIGIVRFKRFPVHVGLYAHGGNFVHACEDSGQVRQDPVSTYRTAKGSRLTGWYWPAATTPRVKAA